jgi:hypothetical protein
LTLLVAGIAANDDQFTLAPHQLAILANPLYTGSHFHLPLRLLLWQGIEKFFL